MNRLSAAAAGLAALLALAACSSSSSGKSGGASGGTTGSSSSMSMPMSSNGPASGGSAANPPASGAPTITISNFSYSGSLTVKAGAKVTVINKDSAPHSLTDKQAGKFDTGVIASGATGSFTAPTKPGSYSFGCTIHPSMSGTLVVTG